LSDRHSSIPVILTSVQTANEADALTTRVNDISASSFKIKLQEQESNPESHLEETVGYIAIEPGSLSIDNNDLFISSQENISNSPSALSSTGYQKILAATQSINEEDTAALRKSGLTGSLLQISLQEEKSLDPEVTHADETIAYILISTPYTVNFTAGENGTITGDESQRLDHGENTTPVTAVPNSNYHFISWSDGNTDNPRTINNVTEDKTLNASFAINTYSVVFTAGDNGTITGNANQTINHAANSSSVTATPNTGYHFVSWSDANTNPTRIITNVTADKTLSATFAINTYTLAFTAGNNGTITGNASQTINHGANSTSVIATPNTGYHFVSWSDANTNPTRTINNVTADKTLSATFAINTYTLAFTAGNNGNITGNASQTINHGANSTSVTATPSTGYHFVSWNDGNTNATRVFTNITADKALSATFAINTYTLAFTAGNNGTITGNANQAINHGANSTAVTATPNSNYHFVSWSDGNTSNPRTINNIIANKALSATFAINTYTLAFTAGNNGTITGSANQTINHGANSSSVTATPNTGYHFVSWSDGNTNATRAFTNVIANKALSATFAINTYTLAFTAGDNGAITGSANQTINHGENSTSITATPNSGYQFEKWSDNNTNNPRTVTNVTANQNLTASFKLIEQTPISGIFFSQAFEHDQLNRRNKVTQLDQSKWSLTYDSKGNLRSALKVDINTNQVYYFQYTYDDIGNRITSNQDGVIVQYTANDLNQYTSIVSNGVTETRQYDADANPLNIRQWDMGWDFENRLTSCNDQASDINVEFAYSFDHMRAWKKVIINGQTAKWIGFVYKGRLLVAEIDLLNDRKPIRTYTWGLDPAGTQQQVGGIGALLSMDSYQTDGSKKHYRFINDASGNVVKVLEMHDDNTITVANSYEYGPFGQVIAKSETVENPFQFQTKYYDKETGFSDYGFRYYDPIDGRWVNRDPIGIDGGINTYNFVSNNPVNPFSGGLSLNGGMQLYSGGLGRGLGVDPWGENFAFEIWDAPGNEGLIYDDAGRAADSIHQTITELVAFLYPLEISRKLVRQFGYKRGPLKLTKQEMIDVVPVTIMDFDANPIDNIDTPFLKMVKEMASKGEKTKKLLNYGITQITFVAGTLGRFTARYTGNLKVTSKDGKLICWEFDGSVSFFDLWDFNTDSATDEAAQSKASEAPRTTTAKKDIALAKKYFRGQPYKITSVSVPIVLSANYYNDKKVSQTSTWPGEKFPKRFRGNRSRFIEPEINTLR
jgi:RHS repeat-associated protein